MSQIRWRRNCLWSRVMGWLTADFRYAIRTLFRTPVFAVIAAGSLALGIGANTAILSLLDQMLIRTLPVKNPQELVALRSPGARYGRVNSDDGDGSTVFSYPMYKDLRDRNSVFTGLLARYATPLSVTYQGQTERAGGELVSGNYFEVLGVDAAIGRTFTPEDDRTPGASPLAVLSYGYWTRRFANDPTVLNQTMIVNGHSLTVIGVARRGFQGVEVGESPDVFIPITMKAQMTPNWDGLSQHYDYWLNILGRLKPGLSRRQAAASLEPIYRALLGPPSLSRTPYWSSPITSSRPERITANSGQIISTGYTLSG